MPSGSDDDAMRAFSRRAQRRQPLTLATIRSASGAPAPSLRTTTLGDAADRPSRHRPSPSPPPPPPPPPPPSTNHSSKLGLRLPVKHTLSRPLQPVQSTEESGPISPFLLEPKTYAPIKVNPDPEALPHALPRGDVLPSSTSLPPPDRSRSPWEDDAVREDHVTILGETSRGGRREAVCLRPSGRILVLKRVDSKSGRQELELLRSLRNDHIVTVRAAYEGWGSDLLLDLQPARYTLGEIMTTGLDIQPREVRSVASAMFNAIRYLARQNWLHGQVDSSTIRICDRTHRPILCNFENASRVRPGSYTSTDLDGLNGVLLEVMAGRPLTNEMRADAARGVDDLKRLLPDRWAREGDLLQRILRSLDASRPALERLDVKIEEVIDARACDEQTAFTAHIYLVPMECAILWDPSREDVRLRRVDVSRIIDQRGAGQQTI